MGMIKDAIGIIGTLTSEKGNQETWYENDQQLKKEAGYENAMAADALQRGGTAAGFARMNASKVEAQQHVAYANSGVDASTGTAADVQASTAALGEHDAQVIGNNAAREAFGHKKVEESIGFKRKLLSKQESARVAGVNMGLAGQVATLAGDFVKTAGGS